MLKKEANVRVHQVLHLCLLLLVCAQCSSMWVTWLGSESSHHLTSILQSCNIPLSLSGFPSKRSRAPDLLHHFPSPSLCSALPANRAPWRSRPSHTPFTLFHPLCKVGCTWEAGSMFVLLELTSEALSSPSPGWGPAGLVCSPTLECLRSCADGGYPARGLGGSRVVSRVPSLTAHTSHGPLWSNEFKCPWKESTNILTGIKEFYLSQAEHYSLGGSLLNNSEELLWFSFLFWPCCMACGRRGVCRVLSSNQASNPCPLQ